MRDVLRLVLESLAAMLSVLICAVACHDVVVRDATVYRAEVDFVDAAAAEQVAGSLALIAQACRCEGGAFVDPVCAALAETTLVVQYRMKYHTAYMRYLGGLDGREPPDDPPEIPAPESLCPASVPAVPLRDGGVE